MSETGGHGVNPRMNRIEAQVAVMVQVQRELREERTRLRLAPAPSDEAQETRKATEDLMKATDARFKALAAAEERMANALAALMRTVSLFRSRS